MTIQLSGKSYAALAGGIAALVTIATFADSSERFGRRGTDPVAQAATRIEVDSKADIIRFYVKGEQVALLDALGMHAMADTPAQ